MTGRMTGRSTVHLYLETAMSIPAELSALVRTSTATIKAFVALQQARTDEASEKVLKNREGQLYRALEAQHDSLRKVLELSRRPNESLDLEKLGTGILNGLAKATAFARDVKRIGEVSGRHTGSSKPIIDVEPEK